MCRGNHAPLLQLLILASAELSHQLHGRETPAVTQTLLSLEHPKSGQPLRQPTDTEVGVPVGIIAAALSGVTVLHPQSRFSGVTVLKCCLSAGRRARALPRQAPPGSSGVPKGDWTHCTATPVVPAATSLLAWLGLGLDDVNGA